jgi:FAD/FMN-containing dehydrogenase
MATASTLAPHTFEDAAAALAAATEASQTVRIVGAGTKLGWGGDVAADIELHTTALDEVVAHDAGDLTATLQAGVSLELAQRTFAAAGQMLALDPPLAVGSEPAGPGAEPTAPALSPPPRDRPSAGSSPPATPGRCATATAPRATSSSG